jgi:hypothetical protein
MAGQKSRSKLGSSVNVKMDSKREMLVVQARDSSNAEQKWSVLGGIGDVCMGDGVCRVITEPCSMTRTSDRSLVDIEPFRYCTNKHAPWTRTIPISGVAAAYLRAHLHNSVEDQRASFARRAVTLC